MVRPSAGHLGERHVLGHLGQVHDDRLAADRFHGELGARRERATQLDALDPLVPGRHVLEIRPDLPDRLRRNLGLRIDLILASDALRARCRGASIDRTPRTWERPSDHTPVVLDLADE